MHWVRFFWGVTTMAFSFPAVLYMLALVYLQEITLTSFFLLCAAASYFAISGWMIMQHAELKRGETNETCGDGGREVVHA